MAKLTRPPCGQINPSPTPGPTGAFYHNRFISFGSTRYYMNSDGSVVVDMIFKCNGEYYNAEENGEISVNEWVDRNGKRYFAGPTGAFYHNRYISFGSVYYYMNTDGSIVKRDFWLNGYLVKPDKETGVVSKTDYEYSISGRAHKGHATYILVNISSQNLKYVRNGVLVLDTPVITGMKGIYDTPKGTYSVRYKARNVRLKGQAGGEEWDVLVSYWIAFYGSEYGFHDFKDKDGYFGGNTYTWWGSHGCVNMPLNAAAKLYSEASVGTIVFIE